MRMKNFVLFLITMLFSVSVAVAGIVPEAAVDIPQNSIGLYQADVRLTVYKKPDASSEVLLDKEINYQAYNSLKKDNLFAVVVPAKKLGYLYVTDSSDDENWIEVIYDKSKGAKGWVYKNDFFQFMPWIDFVNIYGRKYGILQLKSDGQYCEIYSNPDENAQVIGKLSRPRLIRLTSVEGNWLLVTALDIDGDTTTGYVRWRLPDGKILMFPDVK